jgi:hypothetical protein
MSAVRNISERPRLGTSLSQAERDFALVELADLAAVARFEVREGALVLHVPLDLMLEHVDASLLLDIVTAARLHTRALLIGAATLPSEALGPWLARRVADEVGEKLELGLDGRIRLVLGGGAGDEVVPHEAEEGVAAGIVGGDAPGHLGDHHQEAGLVAGLPHVEPHPLDHPDLPSSLHPEPIVPRRERPPP